MTSPDKPEAQTKPDMRERWPELFMSWAEIAELDWEQDAQRYTPES